MMKIKIAGEKDKILWNEIVDKSPHGTIFHRWEFLKIVEEKTKNKLYPLICLNNEEPVGVYPLFLNERLKTKIVLSPPPKALLLYLGPIIADYDKIKQNKRELYLEDFQEGVNKFLSNSLHYNYVRIRTSPNLIDARPFLWTGYKVEPLYTLIIDLDRNIDDVWDSFDRSTRVNIKKTEREGVTIEQGSKTDLDFLKNALEERYLEQGFNPTDYSNYLDAVYTEFYPEKLKIFVGNHKGEKAGGLTLFCYKDKVTLWIGIPKTNLPGVYPNDLAIWESIKWAHENGFKQYEIMEAGDDPRLRRFKSKFNPDLALWYSAERYSSKFYKTAENTFRVIQKTRKR